VVQNAQVTLYTLPRNGTLYIQESLGAAGRRVQVLTRTILEMHPVHRSSCV